MNDDTTTKKLVEDLREALNDAEALLKESAADVGEKTREVQNRLQDRIRSVRDALGEREAPKERLVHDLRSVMEDVEALFRESAENVGKKARDWRDRLTARIDSLRDSVGEREK